MHPGIAGRFWRRLALLTLCVPMFAAVPAAAQQNSTPASPSPSGSAPPATAAPEIAIPDYPNSAKGLERFMKTMMNAQRKGDTPTVQAYAKSLELPNADQWFASAFGPDAGPRLAAGSAQARSGITVSAPALIAEMMATKRTDVRSLPLDATSGIPFDGCGGETNEEYSLLVLLRRPQPLYDVRFIGKNGEGAIWAYFAYAEGGFRYVGNLDAADAQPAQGAPPGAPISGPRSIRVGQKVEAANLIHLGYPKYPDAAKAARVTGTVRFDAIIGTDGYVRSLKLVSGPCILAIPAWQAIKQWRYRPTLLNGQPVEVNTTIEMQFTLGN